jgi:hypothetical protein
MLPAVAAAAALATGAFWLFTGELLDDRRKVDVATALFTFCPFMLQLGATYLNYVFALALQLAFGWMLLRGLRTRSTPWLIGAGFLWSLAFYTRPYDGILAAVPLGLFVLWRHRRRLADLRRPVLFSALGALPILALAMAANHATSGSPFRFPTTQQSEGAAAFFFGERNIMRTSVGAIDYDVGRAFWSMWDNLFQMPTWLVGSWLVLVPLAYGALRLWGRDRDKAVLLLALTFIWPVGYLFWFASALTVPGAKNGLGPHYYLPMTAPAAVLTAVGLVELWERRRQWLIAGVAVALLISYPAVRPKIENKLELAKGLQEDYAGDIREQLDGLDGQPALVVLERTGSPFVMLDRMFLENRPDLTGPVLYAVDVGPDLAELLDRYPDRTAFRIQRQLRPGDDLVEQRPTLQPLRKVSGGAVTITATVVNTSGKKHVTAFLRSGDETVRVVLDDASSEGRSYEVTWTLRAGDGLEVTAEGGREPVSGRLAERGELALGASFSASADAEDPDRVERRYDHRTGDDGTVDLVTGEKEWTRVGAPFSTWLPIVVDDQLQAEIEAVG